MIGLASPSEKRSDSEPPPWKVLRDFHRELQDIVPIPDALKIRSLGERRGLNLPTWFLGSLRASSKLASKHPKGHRFIASTDTAEMASRKEVAFLRFSFLNGRPKKLAFFPACGAGLDLIHFHELYPEISTLFSDIEPDRLQMARANLEEVSSKNTTMALCHDLGALPFNRSHDYTFVDPARRRGNQTLGLESIEPSLSTCLSLVKSSERFQIKLPAGFQPDRDLPLDLDPSTWQWDWIQFGRDVLECVGTHQPGNSHPRGAHFIDSQNGQISSYSGNTHSNIHLERVHDLKPEMNVFIPEPVLNSSGLLSSWAHHHQLKTTPWAEIFTSSSHEHLPLGKTFRWVGQTRPKLKDIFKNHPHARQHRLIAISGEKRFPSELQKSLESHNREVPKTSLCLHVLFLTRGSKNEVLLLEKA